MDDQLIEISIIDRANQSHSLFVPFDVDLNLMEICKAQELPILGTCGGMALCSTCHIYIESDHELLLPNEDEEVMLDQVLNYQNNSRLGCQIKIDSSMDGLSIRIAPEV